MRDLVKEEAAVASPALPCSWDTTGAWRRCWGGCSRRRQSSCRRQSRRYGW